MSRPERSPPWPQDARDGRVLLFTFSGWFVTGFRGTGRLGEEARGVREPSLPVSSEGRVRLLLCMPSVLLYCRACHRARTTKSEQRQQRQEQQQHRGAARRPSCVLAKPNKKP